MKQGLFLDLDGTIRESTDGNFIQTPKGQRIMAGVNETNKLLEIKQKLENLSEELANRFPPEHPRWNDIFEDVGAAGYYLEEANYRIQGAIKTLADDE